MTRRVLVAKIGPGAPGTAVVDTIRAACRKLLTIHFGLRFSCCSIHAAWSRFNNDLV